MARGSPRAGLEICHDVLTFEQCDMRAGWRLRVYLCLLYVPLVNGKKFLLVRRLVDFVVDRSRKN
jgi:hypothetical protein